MKEHPLSFSAPMARAIITGKKSQTRRVMKIQPSDDCDTIIVGNYHPTIIARHGDVEPGAETFGAFSLDGSWVLPSPYGKPGDLLWGKEAWRTYASLDKLKPSQIESGAGVLYVAGYPSIDDRSYMLPGYGRYRSSRFMPRWASRLILEITDVRVERLHDISAKDILAEGAVERAHDDQFGNNPVSRFDGRVYLDLLSLWAAGWESINGPGSWQINPWVWVIGFRMVEHVALPVDEK